MNIEWRPVDGLHANSWNPNVVLSQEMRLLELSILTQGWLQPILVSKDGTIIDGFHRATLAKMSKALKERDKGLVPCVVLDLSPGEAMMLTVRINRAKGSHVSLKMHDLVRQLIDEHGFDKQQVAQGIGAHANEVDLLYTDGVFAAKGTASHTYSRAWQPRTN